MCRLSHNRPHTRIYHTHTFDNSGCVKANVTRGFLEKTSDTHTYIHVHTEREIPLSNTTANMDTDVNLGYSPMNKVQRLNRNNQKLLG